MEENKIITFKMGAIGLDSPYFSYLKEDEKSFFQKKIDAGIIHTVDVCFNDKSKYGALIAPNKKEILVCEVGGGFAFNIRALETYCKGLAMFFGAKKIVFETSRKAVKIIGDRLNYALNNNRYEKVL